MNQDKHYVTLPLLMRFGNMAWLNKGGVTIQFREKLNAESHIGPKDERLISEANGAYDPINLN